MTTGANITAALLVGCVLVIVYIIVPFVSELIQARKKRKAKKQFDAIGAYKDLLLDYKQRATDVQYIVPKYCSHCNAPGKLNGPYCWYCGSKIALPADMVSYYSLGGIKCRLPIEQYWK